MSQYSHFLHSQQINMANIKANANERLPSYHESARDALVFELRPMDSPPDFDIQSEETKQHEKYLETTIMSHASTYDKRILRQFLDMQAQRAPDPVVRIRGTSKQSYVSDGYTQYGILVDFDLVIPLRQQLANRANFRLVGNARKVYRGTRTKVDALCNDPEAQRSYPLKKWCRQFCRYNGPKQFTFLRTVSALDRSVPVDAIKKVLRDVKYKGKIEVTVEVQDQKVTLLSDHPMSRIRRNIFLWVLCCIFQLWIVFWLLTKRWEVLTIEWPTRSSPGSSNDRVDGDMAATWFEKWRVPIARAALNRLRQRLDSAELRAPGVAWKPLGDFDEVQEWGQYN